MTTSVGGTGVVAILDNGPGPTLLVLADMDGLPLTEKTDLDYASTATATDRYGRAVSVMHACGHDVHVACLLGAVARLAADRSGFAGRLMLVFQPPEELGSGANAMIEDGLFDRFGTPDVVLGQHVTPLPAGMIALHGGQAMSTSDSLTVTLYGAGGHGSRPEATVDPIVMAAATVLRLQTIVAREIGANESAVVTVGRIAAGTNNNIIPDKAELLLNVRTFDDGVRARTLAAIERIALAEARASGAPEPASVEITDTFPALVNDQDATERTRAVFEEWLGVTNVVDPGLMTGSEDVGMFAVKADAPCVFWFLGGADPELFRGAATLPEMMEAMRTIPGNHSPFYAPVIEPTLAIGVEALVRAVAAWAPAA